jgi:hypothetical protein
MYHLLARFADFVGDAVFQGELYLVDYYPRNPLHGKELRAQAVAEQMGKPRRA